MDSDYPAYVEGAKFLRLGEEREEWMYPRDPSIYQPSDKFIDRFRRLGGAVEGDDVEDAIKYGELFPAARGCVAFVKDAGGVAYYVIVDAEYRGHKDVEPEELEEYYSTVDSDEFKHRVVTLWAYVYDRDRAWGTGQWTGQQLDLIEELEPDLEH